MFHVSKKKNLLLGVLLGATIALTPTSVTNAEVTQQQLNEQDVKATLWMQTSAEYRELCYQAYNSALAEVQKAVNNHKEGDRPLAIILDIDETVIDNTPLMSGCIGTNWLAHDGQWSQWCNDGVAEPMPGALEYLNEVDKLGVGIFYISGRELQNDGEATIKNLKKVGFPQIVDGHVLLAQKGLTKPMRFQIVTKDYDVILYMGDSITDFPIGAKGSDAERRAIADQHKSEFGTKYIVLPNPTYGGWESSIAPGYDDMTPDQKDKARKAAMKHWQTHDN